MKNTKQNAVKKASAVQGDKLVLCNCGGKPEVKKTTGLIFYYIQCQKCAKRTADCSTVGYAKLRWKQLACVWIATPQRPIYLYYCKANIKTGNTVVVMQDNKKTFCKGVNFSDCMGSFEHQNAVGKAKRSGTRNTLKIDYGMVQQTK